MAPVSRLWPRDRSTSICARVSSRFSFDNKISRTRLVFRRFCESWYWCESFGRRWTRLKRISTTERCRFSTRGGQRFRTIRRLIYRGDYLPSSVRRCSPNRPSANQSYYMRIHIVRVAHGTLVRRLLCCTRRRRRWKRKKHFFRTTRVVTVVWRLRLCLSSVYIFKIL